MRRSRNSKQLSIASLFEDPALPKRTVAGDFLAKARAIRATKGTTSGKLGGNDARTSHRKQKRSEEIEYSQNILPYRFPDDQSAGADRRLLQVLQQENPMIATPTNRQSGSDGSASKVRNVSTKEERRPSRAELVAPKNAKKINVDAFLEAHRSRRAAVKEKSRDPEITGDSSPSNATVNLLRLATVNMGEKATNSPTVADNLRTQSARTRSSEPKPQPPTPSISHLKMQPSSLLQFKLLWWIHIMFAFKKLLLLKMLQFFLE